MSFDLVFQNAVRLHEEGRLDEAENAYRRILEVEENMSARCVCWQ